MKRFDKIVLDTDVLRVNLTQIDERTRLFIPEVVGSVSENFLKFIHTYITSRVVSGTEQKNSTSPFLTWMS
jgi:hypothetical protein